jgi:hypothetical protein
MYYKTAKTIPAFCAAITITLFMTPQLFALTKTVTVTSGGKTVTVKSTVDQGATDNNGNSHPTEIDRNSAKALGILDANGNPDPNRFESDPCDPNKIKTEDYHIADCTMRRYGVTKPVKVKVTDDANNTVEVNMPVTVALDPPSSGSNLLGEDWMRKVRITTKYVPNNVTTFNNDANEVNDPNKNKSVPEPNRSPISSGKKYCYWPGVTSNPPIDVPVDFFIGTGSPYTIIPKNVAMFLGLPLEEERKIDLSDEQGTLKYLWQAGFIPMTSYPGIFYVVQLPSLKIITTEPQLTIRYENIEVLVPYGFSAEEPIGIFIGSDLLENKQGHMCLFDVPVQTVGQITFLGELEGTWFSPAPPEGDLDNSLHVDFVDFAIFADNWLVSTAID